MPDIAPRSLLYPLTSILDRIPVASLYPQKQPLEVELGAGDGSFIAQYATKHPEHNFFGVERLLGRLRKIERKGRRFKLENLFGVRVEAAYFLEFLLPADSTAALHIYFPDPWPKRKHRKNRLVNERFPALAHKALQAEGVVYLRTDDLDYFTQMNEVFDASPDFVKIPTPEELLAVKTDFEKYFNAQGIPTQAVAYRKK